MKCHTCRKAFLILCSLLLLLFPACNHNLPEEEYLDPLKGFPTLPEDIIPQMDTEFVISDEVLKRAGLPIVKIQTQDNAQILSKEDWISASMDIISDNSDWNMEGATLSIRGRGNSSWNRLKRPYAIKLDVKTSVCGMPSQKRWVLLANFLENSFMKNEMAFYLSRQLDMEYTVRGQYVNLVLNGNYVGLYWLGEQIRTDKNRVNIDDEKDFLIEMDQNYDEVWKCRTDLMNMPIQVKNDDKMTDERLTYIKGKFNALEAILCDPDFDKNTTFTDVLDVDSFAKYYLVNQIMFNGEISHPKSFYLVFDTATEILKAGPVWDFDWSCFTNETYLDDGWEYFDKLHLNPIFNAKVKELLENKDLSTDGVSRKIRELYNQIKISAEMDRLRWGYHPNSKEPDFDTYDEYVEHLEDCINTRLAAIKAMTW